MTQKIFLSEDHFTLAQLHESCFSHGWSAEEWKNLLAGRGCSCLVLAVGEKPVGFLLTRQVLDEAEIISIGIKPECQGQGLSLPLLNFGLESLFANGTCRVFLEVRADNEPGRALYERAGFKRDGIRRNYYKPEGNASRDAVIYVKQHI